jgi:hypothetical protein
MARTMHRSEGDLRAALATLAERWNGMATTSEAAAETGEFGPELTAKQRERARTYRKAATDVLDVLRTGHVPHDLMTTAELEQYGTSDEQATS